MLIILNLSNLTVNWVVFPYPSDVGPRRWFSMELGRMCCTGAIDKAMWQVFHC